MSSYKPRTIYSQKELHDALIADLEVDLKCAIRDGLKDHAAWCQRNLDNLRNNHVVDDHHPSGISPNPAWFDPFIE